MKWLVLTLTILISGTTMFAQQVSNPESNVPVEAPAPAHNYTDPVGPYLMSVDPKYTREWDLEVPQQAASIGPDLPLNYSNARVTTTYFDGLDRPIQEVKRTQSDDDGDVITLHTYDILGRETYSILPYTKPASSSTGKFDLLPNIGITSTYNSNPPTPNSFQEPFSKKEFDNSPLNRVVKLFAPGISWVGSGRAKQTLEGTNQQWSILVGSTFQTLTGGYPRWSIGYQNSDMPQYHGDYDLNELTRYTAKDEDGKISEEFKDKDGRIVFSIAKMNAAASPTPADYTYTCYVYDDLGRLRGVLPPLACVPTGIGNNYSFSLSQDAWDNLCYQFNYDSKGRQVEKKVPGKEVEHFVFDKWDRVVLRQDGLLRKNHQWAFTMYDAQDNSVVTGLWESWLFRADLQTTIEASTPIYHPPSLFYYLRNYNSGANYPTNIADAKILSITYYSNYTGDLLNYTFDSSPFPQVTEPAYLSPFIRSGRTQGLVTGKKTRVLDPDDPNLDKWITSVYYYDKFSRLIQTQTTNYYNGVDVSSIKYTFHGDIYSKALTHRNPEARMLPEAVGLVDPNFLKEIKLKRTYKINIGGNGKVWQNQQSINDGPAFTIGSYEYDHLGNLRLKNLPALNIYHKYNIQNWITNIRADIFESSGTALCFNEDLCYDNGFASKIYNGTIAGIKWQGYGQNAPQRFYGYSYDNLGRLKHAEFGERTGSIAYSKNNNDFTVSNLAYDLNGNIKQMSQRGVGGVNNAPIDMDVLTYSYKDNSNQLDRVDDAGDNNTTLPDFKDLASSSKEYEFDENGNMSVDANKGITSISYNFLNNPEKIVIPGKGTLTYVYDAQGNKLQKRIYDEEHGTTKIIDYIEGFTYENKVLQQISTEEGRCVPALQSPTGGFGLPQDFKIVFNYESFVKDHLGNIRQVVSSESTLRFYFASHEIASANVEQLVFDNIDLVRDDKPGSTDPNDVKAAHLIAEDPEKRIGTAIMLRVMPGDEFELGVDGYYDKEYKETERIPAEEVIGSLINTLNGGITYAGIPVSELPENARIIEQTLNNPSLPGLLDQIATTNESPLAPQAHLNHLIFNEKMELISDQSGKVQIQESTGGWNQIAPSGKITIREPGYMVVYLSNRSYGTGVYFDRLRINLVKGKVREENHYYPFGLTLNTGDALIKQPYKYQGIELEKNFGIETYETFYRGLDPQLGRFNSVDTLSILDYSLSPYVSMRNNPVSYTDPRGNIAFLIPLIPYIVYGTGVIITYITLDNVVDQMKAKQQAREASSETSQPQSTQEKAKKGSANPTVNKARETGQEAHRQKEKEWEAQGYQTEANVEIDDKIYRKDAVDRDSKTAVIIKPETESGKKSAEKRKEIMEKAGWNTIIDYYNPANPAYQPGSPTYIGPKNPKGAKSPF